MDDFSALAETLAAGVGDARGSLILSRDGLVLGAHPPEAENLVKPSWLRLAALGETERGFLQFGTEIWSYVRRGAYAAFVVTGTTVRPGVVIDQIELALLAAEEARARREGLRAPELTAPPAAAPLSKPRTPLHPEARPAELPSVIHEPVHHEGAAEPPSIPEAPPPAPPAPPTREPEVAAEPVAVPPEVARAGAGVWASGNEQDEEEVDRFSLAREFSQLLQDDQNAADG